MCETPVQAIWDHKNLTELAGGVREGQNLPQNGLNLALEPSRGPPNRSMTPEMDPKCFPQLGLVNWGHPSIETFRKGPK